MEGPITRAQLQEGFELKKKYDASIFKARVDAYVEDILTLIVKDLMYSLNFIIAKRLNTIQIAKHVVETSGVMPATNPVVQQYVHYFHKYMPIHKHAVNLNNSIKYCIPQIVDALRKKFPDCKIQLDPLNTYVIIDWS